jgi:drug/metabolite transporter (DMT)-like permease
LDSGASEAARDPVLREDFSTLYNKALFSYNAVLRRAASANQRGAYMTQWWIGLVGVLIMAGGLGGFYYLMSKQKLALDAKAIQFLALIFILPLLLVLGLFNVLGRETIGTVIGVVVGYVLSGFGRDR